MSIKTIQNNNEFIPEAPRIRRAQTLVASLPAKIEEQKKALAEEERKLRAAQALLQKHRKQEEREKRNRRLSHAGGMMEMTGLMEYRFIDSSERDNNQDDLRANLLVGALLELSKQLSIAPATRITDLAELGKAYRETPKANRQVPPVNPLIPLSDLEVVD